ncbi:MAG: protein kinase domain-containing protein, partial [Fimbriiglobus sp.]
MTTQMTTDEFFALVERSGLLSTDRTNPYLSRARNGETLLATPEGVARQLVRDRLLTPFQARQLLRGRYRGFFLTDKYKVLELLGEGGMGRVLLCEHLILHKLVAVKLLQISGGSMAGATERFLREARAAAALDHVNIVRVFDVDKAGTVPFMVMDYVDGTNLHQLVAENGPLAVNRAAEYIRQAALGLQSAHEHGLIHRDIKPGNLLLERNGTVKLLDLGLARFFDTDKNNNLTQKFDEKSVLGTADFIAPEQAMNSSKVDIRADIYSLGCTIYFMLARRFPFDEGSVTQKLMWHQSREPDPIDTLRSDVPPALAAAVTRMMRKKPEERFQTPSEVAAALAPLASGVVPPSPEEMPKVRPTMYQIGLCGQPSSHLLGASDAVTPSPSQTDTNRSMPRRSNPDVNLNTGTGTAPAVPLSGTPRPISQTGGTPPPYPYPQSSVGYTPPAMPGYGMPPPTGYPPATGSYPQQYPTGQYPQPPEQPRSKMVVLLAAVAGLVLAVVGGFAVLGFTGLMKKDTSSTAVVTTDKPITPPTTELRPTPQPTPPTPPTPPPVQPPVPGATLQGAGSTFVEPLMQHWGPIYLKETGNGVAYKGVGSGAGIIGMIDELQEFGCTDAPMSDAQLKLATAKQRGAVVHIPLAMGAVVLAYNVPDNTEPLKLTGPVIADIYLGKITK